MRITASTLLFSLLASGASATGQGNGNGNGGTTTTTTTGAATGGACMVSYSSVERGNSGKFDEEFVQDPNNACGVSTDVCVPDDDTGSTAFQPGTCQSQTCHGKQKPGIIEGVDDDASNEATIRVTICHRTCSANNPWVRITIDDDAWGGPAASGCGHQLQHNVTEDCNVPAKEAQSGMTADEIWGVGRRVDYLIKNHGTRETLRTNMGWDEAPCNNNGKCRHSAEEKDYWFYWERACPYVRHGACCGSYETGACCGDNPYPNVNTDIELKKYACPASASCSGAGGTPSGCADGLLTAQPGEATKYCYSIENTGDVDICGIDMSDPLSSSYDPSIADLAVGELIWVDESLVSSATSRCGSIEETTAMVTGTPCIAGAMPVSDTDPASITCTEEIGTPAPIAPRTPRPVATPAPTPCPLMDNTGSTVCPSGNIVSVLEEKGPTLPGGGEFLWDITITDGNTVSFKVDNPFDDDTDVYVEYHKSVGSSLGAYDVDCERDLKLPGCSPNTDAIEAACISRGDKKFTVVTVYFVSNDSFFTNVASASTVPECCVYFDNDDASWKTVSYTYEIMCEC